MGNVKRNWTVLFIGGASGTGKSTLAYQLADYYRVNVQEADDIAQALKASTPKDIFPVIHSGADWREIGVEKNVHWLINVGREMIPALRAVAERHIDDKLPVIIEGDFICPEFVFSFKNPEIKSFFVIESDKNQIVNNYLEREGGKAQNYRAEISIAHSEWIKNECIEKGINYIESRPQENLLGRALNIL